MRTSTEEFRAISVSGNIDVNGFLIDHGIAIQQQ
jgi:hypothetical protein